MITPTDSRRLQAVFEAFGAAVLCSSSFRDTVYSSFIPSFAARFAFCWLTCSAMAVLLVLQVENQPLYVMVGIACGLAVYTPIRHLMNAADIA